MQNLKLATLQHLLSLVVPFIEEEFAKIDENNGWIKLPEAFFEILILGKFPWWQFYESETQVRALGFAFAKESSSLELIQAGHGWKKPTNKTRTTRAEK